MAKFTAVWDSENFIDDRDFDRLEDAIYCCVDVLCGWMDTYCFEHDRNGKGFASGWDEMINNCCAWVVKKGDSLYEDDIVWEPTAEVLSKIGWVEFSKLCKE